ncbi:hypothetical protein QYE76_071279 [Lolium multiflorum]|uniref:Transposase (putative) gypsy type domain-containing protein n=1 Tax=Lolium multiflorum TaxID=4521 RepID=A0AAD8SKL7_LOLMU|nr:hypothetical protein QYE76_071279 [Lolium multiflorum]
MGKKRLTASSGATASTARAKILSTSGKAGTVANLDWTASSISKRDEKKLRKLGLISSDESDFVDLAQEFLRCLLFSYGIQLWQLTPNSILHLAIFISVCEAFLGIDPHWGLLQKIFYVKRHSGGEGPHGHGPRLRGCPSPPFDVSSWCGLAAKFGDIPPAIFLVLLRRAHVAVVPPGSYTVLPEEPCPRALSSVPRGVQVQQWSPGQLPSPESFLQCLEGAESAIFFSPVTEYIGSLVPPPGTSQGSDSGASAHEGTSAFTSTTGSGKKGGATKTAAGEDLGCDMD